MCDWASIRVSKPGRAAMLSAVVAMAIAGCSVRKFAVNKLGDSLANGGTAYASDNDPEFVGSSAGP